MIELYEMAAAKNHYKAIVNLASIYADGDGVKADEGRAVELLERGMSMNAPLAYASASVAKDKFGHSVGSSSNSP